MPYLKTTGGEGGAKAGSAATNIVNIAALPTTNCAAPNRRIGELKFGWAKLPRLLTLTVLELFSATLTVHGSS